MPYSTLAGAWGTRKRVTRLVSPALAALRDENLCIIRVERGVKVTFWGKKKGQVWNAIPDPFEVALWLTDFSFVLLFDHRVIYRT